MGKVVEAKEGSMLVPDRVAIVALGPSSLNYVQFVDRIGDRKKVFDETWTLNSYCSVIQSDRLFHMDDIRVQIARAEKNERVRNMLEAMRGYKGPIITSIPHPDYPQCEAFPLAQVVSKYGALYFNNTAAYAIAYAGYLGVREITCFGMDFTYPGIHSREAGRGCCEYWLGKISSHVQVRVAETSTLMDGIENRRGVFKLYGYDGFEVKVEEIDGKRAITMREKELPAAEAVERAYFHGRDEQGELLVAQSLVNGEVKVREVERQGGL